MKSRDILRVEVGDTSRKTFVIRWRMTHLCNYYFDFCIQGDKQRHLARAKGESAQIREKICTNLLSFMENQLDGRVEKIVLYLVGGEVTVLPDFLSILIQHGKIRRRHKLFFLSFPYFLES